MSDTQGPSGDDQRFVRPQQQPTPAPATGLPTPSPTSQSDSADSSVQFAATQAPGPQVSGVSHGPYPAQMPPALAPGVGSGVPPVPTAPSAPGWSHTAPGPTVPAGGIGVPAAPGPQVPGSPIAPGPPGPQAAPYTPGWQAPAAGPQSGGIQPATPAAQLGMPSQGAPPAQPHPKERKALHPAWWSLIGVAVVAALVAGFWILNKSGGALTGGGRPSSSASVTADPSMQFAAGQCLLTAPDNPNQDVKVDCGQVHTAEAIGQVDLDVAQYSTSAVNSAARQACKDLSAQKVPDAVAGQIAAVLYYPPTRTEWQGGQHTASCVVELTIPVTGSIVDGSLAGAKGLYAKGDCLDDMPVSPWNGPDPVGCSQLHIAEVLETFEPQATGDYDATTLDREARTTCATARDNLGLDPALGGALTDAWLIPDQGAWELGDHTVVCIARVDAMAALTGSLLDGTAQLQTAEVGTV